MKPSPIIPDIPRIDVCSKNKLLIMFGEKPPYKKMRRLAGYSLFIMSSRRMQCDGCYRMTITPGSLYGYSSHFHHHFLCEECLTLPVDFTVFEVRIKLHKKSKVNPSGIRTLAVVCTVRGMKKWMRELMKYYPGSSVKPVKDRLHDETKDVLEKSKRLSYVLKQLWDYLPEIEV